MIEIIVLLVIVLVSLAAFCVVCSKRPHRRARFARRNRQTRKQSHCDRSESCCKTDSPKSTCASTGSVCRPPSPEPQPHPKKPYQPICVLYGQDFASVERNYLMPRVTEICFRDVFLLPEAPIFYLQIITTDRANPANRAINMRNLERMREHRHVSVFVSALGSSIVEYLFDLFFSQHIQDTFHVNSFSTAVSLSSEANLLRLFPIDTVNRGVFVQQTVANGSTSAVIVHDSGVWSSGMNQGIFEAFGTLQPTVSVSSVALEVSVLTDAEIIAATNALVLTLPPLCTLIFVIDSNKAELFMQTLQSNLNVPADMKILLGDASISYTRTPEMVDFFNLHDTRIILPFPGFDVAAPLLLQARLDASLIANPIPPPVHSPNATTKLSSLSNYTVSCLDLGFNIAQLPARLRLDRVRYTDMSLTPTLDVLNAIYGIDLFTKMNDPTSDVLAIAFVFGEKLYVTPIT